MMKFDEDHKLNLLSRVVFSSGYYPFDKDSTLNELLSSVVNSQDGVRDVVLGLLREIEYLYEVSDIDENDL